MTATSPEKQTHQKSQSIQPPKTSHRHSLFTVLALMAIGVGTPATASFLPGGLDISSLDGMGDQVSQALSPIQGYLQQVQNLGSNIDGLLGKVTGELSSQLKDALGDLNLPDPEALLDGLLKPKNGSQQESPHSVSGVNPGILNDNTRATAGARIYSQQSLSKAAQAQAKHELEQTEQVAQASGQAAQISGQAAQAANQAAQTASQSAQQAQSRVSTQDALKDLNHVSAAIASGISSQSNQLTSISGQLGQAAQIQAIQTAKLSQINTGTAVSVQQLADVNALLRGQQQAAEMKDVALTDRLNRLTAGSLSFMR